MTSEAPSDAGATSDSGELHNPTTTTAAGHDDAPDTAAELARWKQLARKHEDRAKANADAAKELEKLRAASMTDLERVVAETKSATRAEVLREVGSTRVADFVRLAAVGRPLAIEALLRVMDFSQFLDGDGQPDAKAIQAWVDEASPPVEERAPTVPRVPTGPRGPNTAPLNGDPLLRDIKAKLGIS